MQTEKFGIKKKYKAVALSGMWDKLHEGHKSTIDKAFEISDFVYIAVIGKAALYKQVIGKIGELFGEDVHFNKLRQPSEARLKQVQNYVRGRKCEVLFFEDDIQAQKWFIEEQKKGTWEAFLMSEKDKKGYTEKLVGAVSKLVKNMAEIVYVPTILDEKEKPISSSNLRKQEWHNTKQT